MRHRILILGSGTGGTLAANRLARRLGDRAEIVVVDRDDRHVYQPGLLFVPFGLAAPGDIVRRRHAQLDPRIEFHLAEVDRVELAAATVHLASGRSLDYDVLVIASGAELRAAQTAGLSEALSDRRAFTFYTLEGAAALAGALREFERGRLLVNLIEMPIKCPVAPLEFCFLADWYLRERGIRDQVELVYATPLDSAFTKPLPSERLAGLLVQKRIAMETGFAADLLDGAGRRLISRDERVLPYDLLVTVPLHGGAPFVSRSEGLGDDRGFVITDRSTLQSKAAPNVFALGDAANVPTSKAGSVTHVEGETLVTNVERVLRGEPPVGSFDDRANCFIETGFHKALLIDFNYDAEPQPGRLREARVGPLPLRGPSRLNHMAKLAFQWLYWHVLLPGHELPGISSRL